MLKKRLYAVALLALSVSTFSALSGCSTPPYTAPSSITSKKPAIPVHLPADADLTAMDRQYELVSRGLYLLPDGSVKPLPVETPATPTARPFEEKTTVAKPEPAMTQQPVEQRAVQQRPVRRAKSERAQPAKDELLFYTLPDAIDITKGAAQ